MYVIKFDNGLYWCGYNKADMQIRKAVIYKSIKKAFEVGKDCLNRKEYIFPRTLMSNVKDFKIVSVSLKECEE